MKSHKLRQPATLSDLLMVLFIGLKLTNNIDWPWWLVLSPAWASILGATFYGVYKGLKKQTNSPEGE